MYELDINQYITQPLHHSTRFSSGDLRPNLCKTSLFRTHTLTELYFYREQFTVWNQIIFVSRHT